MERGRNWRNSIMGGFFKRKDSGATDQMESVENNTIDLSQEVETSEDTPLDLATLLKVHTEDPKQETEEKLIDIFVNQYFKEMEERSDTNLDLHLRAVQRHALDELLRLTPRLDSGTLGHLLRRYHRQMFIHLHGLLEKSSTTQHVLLLLKWVLQTYLSQDLLGHPDLRKVDLAKTVDLMLMTDWTSKAEEKLMKIVHVEVRGSLEKIFQSDKEQKSCDSAEAFTALPVDVIQCINAFPKAAEKISSVLFKATVNVCFQELLEFVTRIRADHAEFLGKQSEMTKAKTIKLMRTLKTCQEIRKYAEAEGSCVQSSLSQKITTELDNLDDYTWKLLQENITLFLQTHFKNYFTSTSQKFPLIEAINMIFPKEGCCSEVQTRVMNETYKLTAQMYIKHLIQRKQQQLKKSWDKDIGRAVSEDAELLHRTMLDLAADVQQLNFPLIHVSELLKSTSMDVIKLEVAMMSKECSQRSMREVLLLMPELLRWAGLSASKTKEVLRACPEPKSKPDSWPV